MTTKDKLKSLNERQKKFCIEYLKDLNATQAAIRAGYSKNTAGSQGFDLLKKPEIQDFIQDKNSKRFEKAEIDAQYVLNRLVEIDQMDVADILTDELELKPINQWPKSWRTTLSAVDINTIYSGEDDAETIIKKIKWPDKVRNLELLGKHISIKAFGDKQEDEAPPTSISINFTEAKREE